MKGRIARMVKDKGFGFIEVEGQRGDYFFHHSALRNANFDDLVSGQEVEFEAHEGTKGPRAEDVYV